MSDNRLISDEPIQSFFQIIQSMDTLYEEYARKNHLTYMSLYILEILYDQKRCTQKEISVITLYPKQTVNMVIQAFLKKKWVTLEQTDDDKRSKHVTLTPLGETIAAGIIEPFWAAGNSAFAELNTTERDIMLRTFSCFIHSLRDKVKQLQLHCQT